MLLDFKGRVPHMKNLHSSDLATKYSVLIICLLLHTTYRVKLPEASFTKAPAVFKFGSGRIQNEL
jgi:hypothetical protein